MSNTRLAVPQAEAEQKLSERIRLGEELLAARIDGQPGLKACRAKYQSWTDYNSKLLGNLFTDSALADEYDQSYGHVGRMNPTLDDLIRSLHRDIEHDLVTIRSIADRLDLYSAAEPGPVRVTPNLSSAIFLVHGHDGEARESTARHLEGLGLEVIILHEQPNRGRTIIEKIEAHADVGYAVVLLTGDDVGGLDDKTLQPRARQNVVLELGYFLAALGRDKVCALHEAGVEVPSDFSGVLYVPLDSAGAWRMTLAREIKASGIEVDLNRAAKL